MRTTTLLLVSGLALAGCGQSKTGATNTSAGNNVQAGSDGNQVAASNAQNSAAPAVAASGAVTPDQFRAMMQRDGARKTVQALDNDAGSETLAQVYQGIASGNDQWLAVVPLLSTGTDASTSESLMDALAEALPRNAAGLLRIIGDRQTSDFFKEGACMHPEELSGQAARAYITTAMQAVEAVNDPALQAAKASCLANLRQAQSENAG